MDPTLRSSTASPAVPSSSSFVMTTLALSSFFVAVSLTASIRLTTAAVYLPAAKAGLSVMVSPPSAPSSVRSLSVASAEMVPLILIIREWVEGDQLSVSAVLYRRSSPMLQPDELNSSSPDVVNIVILSDEIPSFTVIQ